MTYSVVREPSEGTRDRVAGLVTLLEKEPRDLVTGEYFISDPYSADEDM
jgi:hypothetical protein